VCVSSATRPVIQSPKVCAFELVAAICSLIFIFVLGRGIIGEQKTTQTGQRKRCLRFHSPVPLPRTHSDWAVSNDVKYSPDANESAPDSFSHGTHRSNSPPPKSAHSHSTL
jgi:hypothetical protein